MQYSAGKDEGGPACQTICKSARFSVSNKQGNVNRAIAGLGVKYCTHTLRPKTPIHTSRTPPPTTKRKLASLPRPREPNPAAQRPSARHPHTIAPHKPSHHALSPSCNQPSQARQSTHYATSSPIISSAGPGATRRTRARSHMTLFTRRKCNGLAAPGTRRGPCGR